MTNIRFDPVLAETVLLAEMDRRARNGDLRLHKIYYRLAEPLYEIEEREAPFAQLHADLFTELGITGLLASIFAAYPLLQQRAPSLLVLAARLRQEEGAVLGRDGQSICLRILPNRFADPRRLVAFVHHELLHAADMLDESFGYPIEGTFLQEGGPVHASSYTVGAANLFADRYRVLWCAYVDARLVQRGLTPLKPLPTHRHDFEASFASLTAEERSTTFETLTSAGNLAHADLLAMIRKVQQDAGTTSRRPGAPCPLCHFPTHRWAETIAGAAIPLIRADFPTWQVEDSACQRCLEVYLLPAPGA